MTEKLAGGAEAIVLQWRTAHRVALVAVTATIGLVLGWLAPRIIGWALAVGGLPFAGPMRLLQRIAESWGSWVLIVLGGVAGVLVGVSVLGGLVGVRVSGRDITVLKGSTKIRFARAQVAAALIDEGHLVLRDDRDVDLIREKLDVSGDEVLAVLRRFDWPVEG